MRTSSIHRFVLSLSFFGLSLMPVFADSPATQSSGVAIAEANGQLQITINGASFSTYRYTAAADDPKWNRPYFYPALADDGTPITSDQWRLGQTEKADHPWHRSIWVGWGDVNGMEHWRLNANQQRHLGFSKIEGDTFVEQLAWDGAQPNSPVLTEVRTVRVFVYPDGSRAIDLTSDLTATNADAVFKCNPLNGTNVEAGLCAVRMAKDIAKDPKHEIVTAAGAHGEKESREKPAAWCDYSGTINGKKYGIAMVEAPTNIGGVVPWHVRDQGLFADIGPVNWTLEKGHTMVFRDLIIIHEGDAAAAKVSDKAATWIDSFPR